MNVFFSDDFDTDATGALPAWLTAVIGTWEVVAGGALAYSSPNILENISHADGDLVVIDGGSGVSIPATADMGMSYVQKTFDGTGNGFTPLFRCNSSGNTWYGFVIGAGSVGGAFSFQLYKSVSGSISTIGSSVPVSGVTWTTGTALHIKVAAIGTTISAKIWADGTSEPGSYQVNITDGSVTAPGYAAFRYASNGATSGNGIDNLQVFGNSSLAAGTVSSSSVAGTTATLTAAAASGGTGPYTYQWYRSASSGFVPQTANLVSGATSLSLNDTGLSPGTTYNYLTIATDSTGAIAWSSQAWITTSSGALTSGTSSDSGVTSTGCTVTNTGASGGTAPYSYQWYRSTTSGFTPGAGNIISGATTLTYADSGLSPSTTYYYKMVTTDAASSTVTAAQISVTTSAPASLTAGTASASNVGSTTATLTSTAASGGYPAYTYQWYRSTTSGFTPGGGNAVSGATSLTLNDTGLTPSTGYYYVMGVTDSHGTIAYSAQASLTTNASFSPGAAYITYTGVKTVQLSASNATGGSGTYTYQWYRSTSSGSNGTALSGATTEQWIDYTASAGTQYYYALQYTDTTGGAQVLTPQVSTTTKAASFLEIVAGFGDSILEGAYSTIQSPFAGMIDQLNFGMPSKEWYGGTATTGPNGGANLSLNYSVSGSASNDWLPTNGNDYLVNFASACQAAGVTRIVTELGGADAETSMATPAATYQSRMSTIIAYLFANVSTLESVHIFGPMIQNEPSDNESIQDCGLLIAYDAAQSAIANGTTIFHVNPLGPYNYFQRRPYLQRSQDLIHPNDYGDQTAGGLWAAEVMLALNAVTPTTIAGYSRSRVANA